MSLYSELKRRNVFRVAIAYLAGAWLLTEVAETLFPLFGFSEAPVRMVVTVLAIGFPLFLIFSWVLARKSIASLLSCWPLHWGISPSTSSC
jgi:hypothetical protein